MSYDPYRGVPPKHDPTVEALANYRDNLHKNFRFSKANIARLLALGILFPFFSWTATQMFLENRWRKIGVQPPAMMNVFGWAGQSRRPTHYENVKH